MYNVIICADSSGGRMELYLFTISSLMTYAIVPCGVWQYRRESLYQSTTYSGEVSAVISFFSTQQRLLDDNDNYSRSGTQL